MIYQEDLRHIAFVVSNHTGIALNFIYMKDREPGARKREYKEVRQLCMMFAKKRTEYSLKTIGLHFGNRDHSTVIHAITETENHIFLSDKFKIKVLEIEAELDNILHLKSKPSFNLDLDVYNELRSAM
jgi:chromosomal replication initiation ATPase DnaA